MHFLIDNGPFILFVLFVLFLLYFLIKAMRFQKQAMTKTKDALKLQEEAVKQAQDQAQAGLEMQKQMIKLMEDSNKLLSKIAGAQKK